MREGWEPAVDDVSAGGGLQWPKMVVGAEGGACGNRKRRARSVSPLLELASLKVCFHFQNETEGGEVSPSSPGLSPLQDTDARAPRSLWQGWQ